MADGQQITTFDDLNKSLAQYRVQKQPKPVQATALQPPPKAPSVGTTAVQAAPAAPKTVATPKPPKEAQPQVLSFDSLTKELNARRAQTGMQPVKPVEPKALQLSPEEKSQQLKETGERALAWKDKQQERLGNFVASKMTSSPEEIKKTLDRTPAWQIHLAHAMFSPLTPYDETKFRRQVQAGTELEQKVLGWADKQVVSFFTDPINVAFMTMTGGTEPLLKLGVDNIFTAMMAKGAYTGFHNAYQAGKAANWDVFAKVGADGHLEAKPEAAPFWESLGDATVSSFFAGMGAISTPHQIGLVREYGKFNDPQITGINKRWSDMDQSEKARALANIQRQQTESGKDTVQHYQDLAHQFGLKPTPKDQAEAAAQFADATRETRERLAQAQRHMDALAKADATIAGAPEKAHRDVGTAVPELPPDESGSPESREALRKLQMGEELTPAEKAIGERERVRSQILLNLEPEQTAGLSDKDFQRWSRQYSQEEIVDGDDLLKLVKSTVARGDIDGAERSLKRGIRWSSEDPSEIPDDVADTPSEKREKAKANAERNTKLSAKIAEAERIVERAKTAKKYELAPVPVLGEMSVPTKSKIWTPEGEREITVMKPAAAEAGNRDLAVLNPSDREYARQQGRERDARAILEAERQRRQQEYVRKAQQAKDDTERQRTALQDSIKRTAEERVKAAESGLKVEEKRPLRFRTEEAARFGEMERQLSDQMSEVANRNMFVTPEQYLRFLRRPNRDQPLTEDERDFLRMDEERKILQHYQDPANLAPVATGVGAAVPPTVKPNVPTMRDRLEGVTNADEARQVLDGADDSQLAQLMNPLNRNLRGTGVVYGRAGERPMFTDSRGELHEGSSWTPHQGVDVVATVPVHPDDLPKWAIPGMDKKFVLQVAGQGDGVFGAADYTAPQIVVGQVDPAAQRGNWDWTDWAAMESKRRDDAFMNELEAIDRQNELENASIELGQQARRAGNTPEQAEQLEKDAQETDEMAKAIIEERSREEARNQPPNFPEAAPVKELGRGRETEIALPNGRRLKAHYALVSLDDVIASHLPNRKFEPNDKYIGWNDAKTMSILQPNDYFKNVPRQDETKYRAANPDFGQIFNTSSTGDQGPPVLRRDGIVAGGNNRTMVMEMLYASGRGNEVVNAINATKDQFGITEATPPFEDSPAIVRVLDEPMESREELITLGQQLNRDQMTKRNAAEDAAATALHFTPDFMDWIAAAFDDMDDEASLRDFMTKYATQIADKYEQYDIISHTERGQFIDENKEINPAGKLKFENAVRGVVIQDPASLAVLQEPGLRAQARAIDRALPGLLRMTAKGGIWDIHDYLPGAIRHWESINDARDKLDAQIKTAKEHGQKGVSLVDVYLYPERVKGTTRGFDFAPERPKLDPITEALMRLMELKPAEMKEAFNNYSLDAEGIHAQTNLLAEPLLPWASFDKHIGSKVGVEVQESDWGRIEAKPSEKPVEAAAVPPKVEAVQPEQKFKKGSTQTDIPAESEAAKSLEAARQRISDADLAGKGKDVGGNHVTVRYGIEGDDTGGIRDYLRSQRPFDALLGKTEKFKPTEQSEGAAVIQAPIDAPELHRINEELAKHGQFMKPTFDYKPHATVAYVKPEAADRYVGMDVTAGKTFRVDSVTISYRDGSTEEIKLEGRPESLQAPPKPPLAATPEAGGLAPPPPLETPMNEESLRTMLADHPGITPAQREGMIQVWKAFAEKYQGVPFDQWIRDKWKGVKVGGEYKGQEGLQQGSSAAVTWAYHPQKGILTDRAGRKAHDQLLREAGVDHMVGRAFDQMPRGKAMVDPYSRSLVVTLQGDGDLSSAAERELRDSLDVPSGYETRVNHAALFQSDELWQERNRLVERMEDLGYPVDDMGEAGFQFQDKDGGWWFAYDFEEVQKLPKEAQDTLGELNRVNRGLNGKLFQGDDKVVRGLTEFTEDGAAVMHLFEHANFSTFAHESFHIMRRYLKPGDLAVLEKHLKVKDGAWTAKAEEDAARSWERYLRDGEAPTPELKTLFAKLKAWMSAIYAKLKGTPLDIKVSADVRKVFDRMLTGEAGPEAPERKAEPLAPPPAAPEPKQEAPAGENKAVDANGKPLTVYHATNADFDTFDPDMSEAPYGGMFFTAKPETPAYLVEHKGGKIVTAQLEMKNPLVVKTGEYDPGDYADGTDHDDIRKAKDEGRDGVIYQGKDDAMYVVFRADQVKKVTGPPSTPPAKGGEPTQALVPKTGGDGKHYVHLAGEGAPTMNVRVDSAEQASAAVQAYRDKYDISSSAMGEGAGTIFDPSGNQIGYVSYNGRVWPGTPQDWKPGTKPLQEAYDFEKGETPAERESSTPPAKGAEPAKKPRPVSKAAREKAEAEDKRIREFFTPGNVVLHGGTYDKVLEYIPGDPSKPYPANNWQARVIESDEQGNPKPGARERVHATPPDKRDKVVKTAPVQELDKAPEPPTSQQESGGSAEPALPGFETAVAEQSEAAAAHRSEELAGEIAAPKGDISRATGEMESKSPLFRETEASPQNEMFAPLSPEDAKDVQESLGLPDKLFQDDSPQARDMKLRMIRDKLKMPGVSGELRRKLEAMQAQLQGEPHGGTTPETPTGAGKPGAEPIQPPPTAPEAKREVKRETAAPKKTVKIWTPHGEIEVAREEPRREAPPKADAGRGAVDVADRDQRTRVPEPLSERPQPTTRSDTEPPAGRGVRPPAAGGRGRTRPGTGEESLPDVTPTRIAPPKRERGVPIYAPEQWKSKLELFRLPENMPVPFVALDSDIARLLIFPGQKELAESALSGLKQHDAYVLATSTGSGKTFLASAVVSQIVRREKPKNVLILTPSQNLVTDFKNVLLDFDVDAKSLPDGVAVPEEEGAFVTTFATANLRDGIADHPWDLVVMDEADAARRWYSSQQGAMAKKLGEHAGKVLYMSATPFHTALELGHMTKLGLWDNEGFDQWGKQFGIYRDKEGNYGGGNAPRKLVTLRQQLIERGQFAQLDRNMEGYYPHFLLAPLSVEEKQGLRNIEQAFGIAKDYYARKGKKGLMRSLQGNMVVYMKSYLERTRLPQAIELAKRAEKEGYKAIIFSEHKTGRDELFSLLQEPDEHSDGEIKRLLPMIPDVVDELQKAFGDDIANFSGKHSTMRDEEKKAFIGNEKKHIYATYGAGGRGVSLHDTNGKHPRIAIYLGPPYSGVMLDQAIGRPWRFGTKSNVQAYFMLSNARDEVDLVIKKVAPRLESLRALVSGIDMTDPMTVAMRRLESAQDGAMAFDLGQDHTSNAGDLANTYDNVPIMNWREAPMPPATEQMNKGMRLPGETMPHPGISRLMQSEEYELPADMELPESTEAKIQNDERAEDFAQGNGASELTQGELQSIPAPERVQTAESVQTLAEGAAKDNPEAPRAAVRRTWDNAGKLLKAAQELPPSKAGRSVNWIWFTHGREIIRRSAARAGRAQLGEEMARDIARYHVETGNVAGPFQSRYYAIAKKLTPEEHDNMWLVKEGATRKNAAGVKVPVQPMNEKVVQAVKDTTKLLQDVKDLMAKERIYTEFYDEDTGRRVAVPFAEQVDDPRYMPHRYDYERKIQLVDPKTGAKETMTLREILKGKDLGQYKYERIVDALAADTGKSKAEIEDWLSRRRRDVPLVGNVERAREVDMPYYRTDPEAMVGYLEGAGEVVARQRVFGQDRMKLEAKLREIPNQRDRALIRDIFDSLLSRKQWDEDTRHFVNLAADWSVLSKMAFSAVKIPFHLLHSSLYTNGRTLLKTMFEGVTHPKEMRDRAIYSGAVMEQMRANLASELGMEKRFASKLLRWNLFHSAYSMDRALANASARIWMDDYALPKLKRDAQHSNARRQLKEVYLLGDNAIDKAAASGRWADEDYMRGGKALSDKVMFTFDPTELPPGWRARSNDPIADSALAAARVATLLKSFMFKTGVILKDRLWTEAKKGNFRPWLPFLAFYPVAGEAMRQLGGALTFNSKQVDWWQDPANQDAAKILERTAEDIGYTTGLTSLMWLLQAPLGQKGWAIGEFLAGPFYSDVMHTLYKFPSELAAAKSDYAAHNAITRWMTQTVPASRLPVRGYEEATGWDAEAEKKKAQKEAGHRAAQTRREHKYGNVKPL